MFDKMKKFLKSRKGNVLEAVPGYVIVFVLIAVVLGVGATVVTQVQSTQPNAGYAYNASQNGLTALNTLSSWQNNWAIY